MFGYLIGLKIRHKHQRRVREASTTLTSHQHDCLHHQQEIKALLGQSFTAVLLINQHKHISWLDP